MSDATESEVVLPEAATESTPPEEVFTLDKIPSDAKPATKFNGTFVELSADATVDEQRERLHEMVFDTRKNGVYTGQTLKAIKASGLYLVDFKTWDAFCQATYGCKKSNIDKKIRASDLRLVLQKTGNSVTHAWSDRVICELYPLKNKNPTLMSHAVYHLQCLEGEPTADRAKWVVKMLLEPPRYTTEEYTKLLPDLPYDNKWSGENTWPLDTIESLTWLASIGERVRDYLTDKPEEQITAHLVLRFTHLELQTWAARASKELDVAQAERRKAKAEAAKLKAKEAADAKHEAAKKTLESLESLIDGTDADESELLKSPYDWDDELVGADDLAPRDAEFVQLRIQRMLKDSRAFQSFEDCTPRQLRQIAERNPAIWRELLETSKSQVELIAKLLPATVKDEATIEFARRA